MSITRTAPAPTRATSSVVLSAGLISIPLAVYTSVESTNVTRREFFNGNPDIPVGRISIRRDTEAAITSDDVTRMAQADDGTWVVLTDDEVVDCVGRAGGCEIVSFVPVKDASQYLTDGLYQVRPKNDKRGGAAAVAAFSLLLAGMCSRKVHALVRFSMRGTPRYGLLTAEGDLIPVATADGIREALPLPSTSKPSKAELDMVTSLIDAIGVDAPVVIDDVSPVVRAYVNDKASKGGVASSSPSSPPPGGDVVDLVERLQASIDAVKAGKAVKPKPARKTKVA
jgi:non-homologous end joining protein Ku